MGSLHLNFEKAGLLSTVQDHGRRPYHSFGVPPGGPMDRTSAKRANWLVGNQLLDPILEMTMLGPRIRFSGKGHIALTGARMSPKINGIGCEMDATLQVLKDDVLEFGALQSGCRSYLAAAGEWQLSPWLKSFSCASTEAQFLTPDSFIVKGSKLKIKTPKIPVESRVLSLIAGLEDRSAPIRVLPGPEFSFFRKSVQADFFATVHTISNQSNRMGYRLDTDIKLTCEHEMISSGIVPGIIQATSSGQPIVLMADAQTCGGYPRFACVADVDLDRMGQLKPGDAVRFELIDHQTARDLRIKFAQRDQLIFAM